MKEKMITVATHTYEKAQLIKMKLEAEGIKCYLKNINLIQGAFTGGVKVRIIDQDLDKALVIIEAINETLFADKKKKKTERIVLIPVDFSDYSYKACKLGLGVAEHLNAKILLIHTYFSPLINTLPFSETFSYDINVDKTIQEIHQNAEDSMKLLVKSLKKEMANGTVPNIQLKQIIREGVPEEEILSYSKNYPPLVIVMGTRGLSKKNNDLIGSVTAEVIERAKVPVLAIPEESPHNSLQLLKNLAYVTSFDSKDFDAIHRLMNIIDKLKIVVHCIHVGHKGENLWDEVRLKGMRDFLQEKYVQNKIQCDFVEGDDMLLEMEKYVQDNKIDIIALNTHRRTIFARLFNPGIARKMLFHTKTPLLVFHT